eukprot:TRINITY_DN12006_c0_g2_i1.p1 TRINITY_DN12006_c0_g2~~TRINITY_DN12006_c0_g2_i1.p1  ORF type:complete len:327 (+),score=84.21 TRINITY_DN12006_c0_g2_i1:58-981(+)
MDADSDMRHLLLSLSDRLRLIDASLQELALASVEHECAISFMRAAMAVDHKLRLEVAQLMQVTNEYIQENGVSPSTMAEAAPVLIEGQSEWVVEEEQEQEHAKQKVAAMALKELGLEGQDMRVLSCYVAIRNSRGWLAAGSNGEAFLAKEFCPRASNWRIVLDPKGTKRLALKNESNQHYTGTICVCNNEGRLLSHLPVVRNWELFSACPHSDDSTVSLEGINQKLLSAHADGTIACDGTTAGEGERWRFEVLEGPFTPVLQQIALKSLTEEEHGVKCWLTTAIRKGGVGVDTDMAAHMALIRRRGY